MTDAFALMSSFAVACVVLWRLRIHRRPASGESVPAWGMFGIVHVLILLSVAIRAVRLLSGQEPCAENTALFYLLVAIGLMWFIREEKHDA